MAGWHAEANMPWRSGPLQQALAGVRGVLHRAAAVLRALPQEVQGLGFQVLSTMCVSAMALCAKVVQSAGVPLFQVVLVRSTVLLAFSTALLLRERANPFRSDRKVLLLLRGLLGFGAVSSIYFAVHLLPLADAAVLVFLAPIIVALLSPLVLKEPASWGTLAAIPLAAAGVLLVAQPTALFGDDDGTEEGGRLSLLGVGAGLLQALFSASAKMSIRVLNASEPVASIVFSQSAVSFIGSAILCAALPSHFVAPPSAVVWLLLLGTGVLGCGVQLFNTWSLRICSAAPAMAMSFVQVLWGMTFDIVVFHQLPSGLSLLGAAFVCCAAFVVVLDRSAAAKVKQVARPAVTSSGGTRRPGGVEHAYELVRTETAKDEAEDAELDAVSKGLQRSSLPRVGLGADDSTSGLPARPHAR